MSLAKIISLLKRRATEVLERFVAEIHSILHWIHPAKKDHLYRFLSDEDLRATKNRETLFIFGCGYSLNDLTAEEISFMERHQTMGFNWFVRQNFVRCDYYVVREVLPPVLDAWRFADMDHWLRIFVEQLKKPHYDNTVYVIQREWMAYATNRLISRGFLPHGARVFPFFNSSRAYFQPPTKEFSEGLVHGPGTLADCINFGSILGFKRIVLVGVDLYDQRYFWLPPNQTRPDLERRNIRWDQPHPNSAWIVDFFRYWRPFFEEAGVKIEVFNPRSLLNEVLDVYDRKVIRAFPRTGSVSKEVV